MNRRQFISTTAKLTMAGGVYVVAQPGTLLQAASTDAVRPAPAPIDSPVPAYELAGAVKTGLNERLRSIGAIRH
jgi:hypothetical protein